MTKIFIVTEGTDDFYATPCNIGVFSNLDAAEKFVNERQVKTKYPKDSYDIQEWDFTS